MIRVIGLYRWTDGAVFDHDYYNSKHMELTRELLAPRGLVRLESDQYFSVAPPKNGDVIAASHAYFASPEEAKNAMTSAAAALMADVPKYTNLKPEILFGSVVSHG